MSGHWGPSSATILNVTIVESNPNKNYILVKGGVPGPKKSIVTLRSAALTQFGKVEVKPLVDLTPNDDTKKGE